MISFQSPDAWQHYTISSGNMLDTRIGAPTKNRKRKKRDASPVKEAVKKLLQGALKYSENKMKKARVKKASPLPSSDSESEDIKGGNMAAPAAAILANPELTIPIVAGTAIATLAETITPKLANHIVNGLERAVVGISSLFEKENKSDNQRSSENTSESEQTPNVNYETTPLPIFMMGGSATIPKLELEKMEKRRIRRLVGKKGTVQDFINFVSKNYARKLNKDHLASVLAAGAKNLIDAATSPELTEQAVNNLSIALLTKWPEVVESSGLEMVSTGRARKNAKLRGGAFGVPLIKRTLSEKQVAALAKGREMRRLKIQNKKNTE